VGIEGGEMNEKKANDYKVSWGSWKDVWEILVHIVLAICVIYAVYSFFHQEETESGTVEKTKAEKIEKQDQASEGC
jgi:Tfp pilus assembly protein PilO